MDKNKVKQEKRKIRHTRVRKVVSGSALRPRLSVFRSGKNIYAQLIDDASGRTLVSASTTELKAKAKKTDASSEVGKLLAEKAKAKEITAVVFDRGGYKYHGRVKALADGAREGGLTF